MKIFDAHLHIIDPAFPLQANHGYLPDPFTCDDYLAATTNHDLVGGAVVSGSFQAFDQTYLVDALSRLGQQFVGVTQLPASVSDAAIVDLDRSGVRALRFNLKRGGSETLDHLDAFAHRVHDLVGWHVELYVDSTEIPEIIDRLIALPKVSIDHLGLSKSGFPWLMKLVDAGVHVKATGFGRTDFDVRPAIEQIYQANPNALMFGTDLPSTRAPRPFHSKDVDLVVETLGETAARRVLFDNASAFYGNRRSINK